MPMLLTSGDLKTDARDARCRMLPIFAFAASCLIAMTSGCWDRETQPTVVVYTALDREFSQPIFEEFEEQSGIRVLAKFDTESTKTVGLANAILEEAKRPRCDLFWNNEILNTLRLQKADLLRPVEVADASEFPRSFRSPPGNWHGFAARARVFIINTDLLSSDQYPSSVKELADPKWKGQVGIAKPLFGTTATHAAILFARWGHESAQTFFENVNENAQVLSGNKQVAIGVANGRLAWGITDTDDAIIEVEKGMPVTIVYPDQGENGEGTLFIPNTLAAIRGAKHTAHAEQLINFLLSPAIEQRLAKGPSAQIPLRESLNVALRVESPKTVKAMEVDFEAAAENWDAAREALKEIVNR